MKYYFLDYSFDATKLNLYYNDKAQHVRPKVAEVLALFLGDPDRIFSKEDILMGAWGRQIVSDQVIFQTISEIRNIFGGKSIKTFPKKGYQWQTDVLIDNSQPARETDRSFSKLLKRTPEFVQKSVSHFLTEGQER